MSNGRTCTWCGAKAIEWCEACQKAWSALPDAATMSHAERLAELVDIVTNKMVLEIPLDDLQMRVEALMQRPVWTHEFARPENLVNELRSRNLATFDDVIAKVPSEKLLVVKAVNRHDRGQRRAHTRRCIHRAALGTATAEDKAWLRSVGAGSLWTNG